MMESRPDDIANYHVVDVTVFQQMLSRVKTYSAIIYSRDSPAWLHTEQIIKAIKATDSSASDLFAVYKADSTSIVPVPNSSHHDTTSTEPVEPGQPPNDRTAKTGQSQHRQKPG